MTSPQKDLFYLLTAIAANSFDALELDGWDRTGRDNKKNETVTKLISFWVMLTILVGCFPRNNELNKS